MWTVSDVINLALRKSGIASNVQGSNASADMVQTAFEDYLPMIKEFANQINIKPYITNQPGINDFTGLSDEASQAMAYQLGLRIAPDYLIEPTETYKSIAAQTLENLRISLLVVPDLERRGDMPFGAGWKSRGEFSTFYTEANIVGGSYVLAVNDVKTLTLDFSGMLNPDESITGHAVKLSQGAQVTNVNYDGAVLTYTITFSERGAGWVAFTVAGDEDSVMTLKSDFDVRSVDA